MNKLIKELQEKGEDFEFYPTSNEIIEAVCRDLKRMSENHYFKFSSVLDIGAGNGKVLLGIQKHFPNIELYGIEKSATLRASVNKSIYIIGTDFYEQSLIDKSIDITFCNPPYSEYTVWVNKILRESTSKYIYLVIPKRWEDSAEIKETIQYREAETKVIGEYTFENAEDRQARAVVHLLRIELSKQTDDAFDRFFNAEFAELKKRYSEEKEKSSENGAEEKFSSLVLGRDYVQTLVEMYNADLAKIKKNYDAVNTLDGALLREFEVSPEKIAKLLKEKLKNHKNLYWGELLTRMQEITRRLATKKRDQLFNKLHANGHVDFTKDNVYAIVLWILKNASAYIDEQLIDVYEEMISKANIHNYKSNKKVYECNRWRYRDEKPTHIYLDFRIIMDMYGTLEPSFSGKEYQLSERACNFLRDMLTISHNLGWNCDTSDYRLDRWKRGTWFPGKPQEFYGIKNGNREVVFEAKAFQNGNIHIRMNQKLALALNVEYGRLKGWIFSGKDAADEMSEPTAEEYFKSNCPLLTIKYLMLEDKAA